MKKTMIFIIVLLLVFAIGGCRKDSGYVDEKNKEFRCNDGRIVYDERFCNTEDLPQQSIESAEEDEPALLEVETTEKSVGSENDARSAFNDFVENNNYDYEYVSSEFYKTENGLDYYKVVYSYNELGGGKNTIIIDSKGNFYVEKPLI